MHEYICIHMHVCGQAAGLEVVVQTLKMYRRIVGPGAVTILLVMSDSAWLKLLACSAMYEFQLHHDTHQPLLWTIFDGRYAVEFSLAPHACENMPSVNHWKGIPKFFDFSQLEAKPITYSFQGKSGKPFGVERFSYTRAIMYLFRLPVPLTRELGDVTQLPSPGYITPIYMHRSAHVCRHDDMQSGAHVCSPSYAP